MADDVPPDVHPDEAIPAPPGPPPPVALEPPPPPAPPPERTRSKAVPIAIGAAALAVVVAVVAIVVGGGKKSTGAAHPSAPATIAPPGTFTAIPESFSITLNWVAPPGVAVTGYTILRNGSVLSTVDGHTTTYTDASVTPGLPYTYDVEAVVGARTSAEVAVMTQTPVPALADARLDGQYTVHIKYLEQTGYITTPKPRNLIWQFTPLCATGPCNVSWFDAFYKHIRGTLRRNGTNYHGAAHGFFGGGCSGKKTVQGLTVSIRVTTAKAFGGEWVSSRFVGTIIENDAPQFGCVGPTATMSVTGTLST